MHARRARQLVVTFMTTVGNYDYGINYVFHQDGVLEVEAELTGILLARARPRARPAPGATRWSSGTSWRRRTSTSSPSGSTLDVDGRENTPVEMTAAAVPPGRGQPRRQRVPAGRADHAHGEGGGGRRGPGQPPRVAGDQPAGLERLGHPVGYAIVPGTTRCPTCCPDAQMRHAPGSSSTTCGSPGTERARRARPARTRTRARPGRAAGLDRRRRAARGSGRGGLVHLRRHPLPAGRGVAGDERGARRASGSSRSTSSRGTRRWISPRCRGRRHARAGPPAAIGSDKRDTERSAVRAQAARRGGVGTTLSGDESAVARPAPNAVRTSTSWVRRDLSLSRNRVRCCCSRASAFSASPGCGSCRPESSSPSGDDRGWRSPASTPGSAHPPGLGVALAITNCCFYVFHRTTAPRHRRSHRVSHGHRICGCRRSNDPERPGVRVRSGRSVPADRVRREGEGEPVGLAFAFANAVLFALDILLGHRWASPGPASGIDGSAASMRGEPAVVTPIAGRSAMPALFDLVALAAGTGVGLASSVIPWTSRTSSPWHGSARSTTP